MKRPSRTRAQFHIRIKYVPGYDTTSEPDKDGGESPAYFWNNFVICLTILTALNIIVEQQYKLIDQTA